MLSYPDSQFTARHSKHIAFEVAYILVSSRKAQNLSGSDKIPNMTVYFIKSLFFPLSLSLTEV